MANAPLQLDLFWSFARRFWCEHLFRDQKSGPFQLESSGLRQAERTDRLLLVTTIAVLVACSQGCAISLGCLRAQIDFCDGICAHQPEVDSADGLKTQPGPAALGANPPTRP